MADTEVKTEAEDVARNAFPHPRSSGYKSYRKKYRKMRLKFEQRIGETNGLFIREHRAWEIARRLQEQNDQLLDIITDLMLESPEYTNATTSTLPSSLGLENLEKEIPHTSFNLADTSVLPQDLKDLENEDGPRSLPPAYLTTEHEEAYLAALDQSLSAIPPTDNLPIDVETIQPNLRSRDKTVLTEEDFAHKNPVSVHNWMKKHQPDTFDKQKDKEVEKPLANGGRTEESVPPKKQKKKDNLSKQDQQFMGLDDEIGFDPTFDPPPLGSSRTRRKKDDETYRPKGGKSRSSKRKREIDEGDVKPAKGGKKAKTTTSAAQALDEN